MKTAILKKMSVKKDAAFPYPGCGSKLSWRCAMSRSFGLNPNWGWLFFTKKIEKREFTYLVNFGQFYSNGRRIPNFMLGWSPGAKKTLPIFLEDIWRAPQIELYWTSNRVLIWRGLLWLIFLLISGIPIFECFDTRVVLHVSSLFLELRRKNHVQKTQTEIICRNRVWWPRKRIQRFCNQ